MINLLVTIVFLLLNTRIIQASELDLTNVVSECLTRDWMSVTCEFEKNQKYNPGAISRNVGQPLYMLPRIITQLAEDMKKMNGPRTTCSNSSESKMNLLSLTSMIQHAVKTRKLSSCKAACMATCLSSTLIKYDISNSSMQTPCRILEDQKGGCAEFATFSVYFARQLGLNADVAYDGNNPHNFMKIEIEKKEYYMEPQRTRCQFFEKY